MTAGNPFNCELLNYTKKAISTGRGSRDRASGIIKGVNRFCVGRRYQQVRKKGRPAENKGIWITLQEALKDWWQCLGNTNDFSNTGKTYFQIPRVTWVMRFDAQIILIYGGQNPWWWQVIIGTKRRKKIPAWGNRSSYIGIPHFA